MGDFSYEDCGGLTVIQAHSIRSLVEQANDAGVMKEDIVNILRDEENWFLLYYK